MRNSDVLELIIEIDNHLAELQKIAMTMNQWRRQKFMKHITFARHKLSRLKTVIEKQTLLNDLLSKLGEKNDHG